MTNEYQPGLTELRLNAKAYIEQNKSLTKELYEMKQQLQAEQKHRAQLSQNLIDLQKQVQALQVKLFENGIR